MVVQSKLAKGNDKKKQQLKKRREKNEWNNGAKIKREEREESLRDVDAKPWKVCSHETKKSNPE
jgi:hypothetical protein